MKPTVERPPGERQESSAGTVPGETRPGTGKSGEGAASALEHLLRQERARVLHNTIEPSRDHAAG